MAHIQYQASKNIEILDFKQDLISNRLVLKFSSPAPIIFIRTLDSVPHFLTLDISKSVKIAKSSDTVEIPITKEQDTSEYSIILFTLPRLCSSSNQLLQTLLKYNPGCKPKKYVEMIRQSQKFLFNSFNFAKPLGYTILGRRTIENISIPSEKQRKITFYGKYNLDINKILLPPIIEQKLFYEELKVAAKIVNFLWDQNFLTGPKKITYNDFLSLTFEEKLKLLQNNKFAVQCSGFRDLFLHASSSHIKARSVDARNANFFSSDLKTYTHSLAEVWIPALNKWVVVDPWLAVVFKSDQGELISAEDLKNSNKSMGVNVIALKELVERNLMNSQGESYKYYWQPGTLKLVDWTITLPCVIPGYLEYFKDLTYGYYEIK